jgi:hypothetical protein
MRPVHVGRLLLALGLLVGLAASVGLLVGFEPSRLPPALLDLAAYKLTYLAAFGLIAAGAVFVRHARRADAPRSRASGMDLPAGGHVPPAPAAREPEPAAASRRAGRP